MSAQVSVESTDQSSLTYTYEEAIERVQVGKFHYILLMTMGMGFLAFITEISALGLIIFPVKCDLQFTLIEQGLLGSAGFLGVTVSAHFMGFLGDTWGRLRTLRTTILISLCTSLISLASTNVWMLFPFRFLTGVFISGCQSCIFSLLGEFHSIRTRVRHVAMVLMFLPAGTIYFPGLAVYILPLSIETTILGVKLLPWRILMLCNMIPSLIALIGCYIIPESPKYLLSQGRHAESVAILRKVYSMNTGNLEKTYPCNIITLKDVSSNLGNVKGVGNAVKLVLSQTATLFTKERVLHTANMCFITFVINLMSQGTFMYFPIIINNLLTFDEPLTVCQSVGAVGHTTSNRTIEEICADPSSLNIRQYEFLFYMGWVFMFLYFFISSVINFTGKKPLFIVWMAVGGLCTIVLHWINNFYVILAVVTMIVAAGNCIGIMITFALEFYPTNINAMGVSFVMMIGRLGAVVGTNIFGPLLFSQCDNLFFGFGIVVGFLVLLAFFLPKGSSK